MEGEMSRTWPEFYLPQNAASFHYRPDIGLVTAAAGRVSDIAASQDDTIRILLLLIDLQLDFCHPDGSLFVAGRAGDGAVRDCARIAEFIYRNTDRLTRIYATLDTHRPFQIFFPEFWLMADGSVPNTHTLIRKVNGHLCNVGLDGRVIGRVMPNPAVTSFVMRYGCRNYGQLVTRAESYVSALDQSGKYSLYLWPHHCLEGGNGHRLAGVIDESILYHSFVRRVPPELIRKGYSPLTESYSVFGPEVLGDEVEILPQQAGSIEDVFSYDAVIVVGQASSHCVKASVEHIVKFGQQDSVDQNALEKFYLLTDCMSPVVVPGADFTAEAESARQSFERAGLHLVESTIPISQWPGFPG
jgi:nicotinamidase-related amidase